MGDEGASVAVIPMPVPVMGYELLELLRYKVNSVTGEIEKIPADEPAGPVILAVDGLELRVR